MSKKLMTLFGLVMVGVLLLTACAPAATPAAPATPQTIVQTVEVVRTVEVAGTPRLLCKQSW